LIAQRNFHLWKLHGATSKYGQPFGATCNQNKLAHAYFLQPAIKISWRTPIFFTVACGSWCNFLIWWLHLVQPPNIEVAFKLADTLVFKQEDIL
jgi:hypothetical protein